MKTINGPRKIFLLLIGVLVLAPLIITPLLLSGKAEGGSKSNLPPAPAAPKVLTDVYVVSAHAFEEEFRTTGSIAANQEVALVSEVARKVTGIFAKEGHAVKKDALLFKLDDADLLAKRKKLLLQEKLALLDEKRFRELLVTEAANQQEYDEVSTRLKVLQAEIELIDVELSKTEIRAPFNGKVGMHKIDIGAYVTPATVLANIEDVSKVEVNFTVPEKYSNDLYAGQRIRFTTENNNRRFEAVITATDPAAEQNTRSMNIKAICDNTSNRLIPGTSAKISLSLKRTNEGISVPTQALIPTSDGYSLFVIKNGKAEYKVVKTGSRNKATIQVLEGLSQGDTVITSNMLRIGPGVAVQAAKVEL